MGLLLLTQVTYFQVLLTSVFILSSSPKAWALYDLHSLKAQLTPGQFVEVQQFFENVSQVLPIKMKENFPDKIKVQFQELGNVHGRANLRKGITLSQQILKILLSPETQQAPSLNSNGQLRFHKTKIQEARGTVIHETAHLYDFLNVRSRTNRDFILNCQSIQDPQMILPDQCEVYLNTKTTLSSDPYYLEIAGWPLSVQGKNYRESHNIYKHRTADALEFKNPVEHFAVNFEYYLLDPEFSCRKPTLAKFFDRHFELQKTLEHPCEQNFYVDPASSKTDQLIRQIPFDRVYQIHYLHAGPGIEAMSLWGHSMFRLVICDPNRKKVGPECMKDEFYHLVLSFRAFINSFSISSWKGLTGVYPSRLFIVPFQEVKRDYLEIELRDLTSYPLHLSSVEKELFLQRALETHWNYDNRYFFITNNCASESLNLLKSSLLRPELLEQKVIKPTELRDLLLKVGVSKSKDFSESPVINNKNGLFFGSEGPLYTEAFSHLTDQQQTLSSVIQHLALSAMERRKKYLKTVSPKTYAAISILETASLNRTKSRVKDSIVAQAVQSASQIRDSYQLSIELFNLFSAPHEFIGSDSYGLPLKADIEPSFEAIKKSWELNKQNSQSRKKLVESFYTEEQRNEIFQTEKFLDQLLVQLKN